MIYNKDNIEQFHTYTLKDYNENLIIEDIAKVNLVEKTDGSFTQIGIRPSVDEDMFILPNFLPGLPGAGRMVAFGEIDFLIKNIIDKLNKDEIKKIEFKENIKEFPKHIYDFNDATILLSTKFYIKVFTELNHRIDYEKKYPRLDKQYRIIFVPERVLSNKIIIISENALRWDKEIFDNKITRKKEKIDIDIKPSSTGKVDITIRSVNKITYINLDLIKVLEVGEEDD